MATSKSDISRLEFDLAKQKNKSLMLQEELDKVNKQWEEQDWEESEEDSDEKEADAALREMENALGSADVEGDKENKAPQGTENSQSSRQRSSTKSLTRATPTAAAAPEATTAPAAARTQSANTTGGLPANITKDLAKALERAPKPVQMPTGALPNANTAPLGM